MAGCISARQRMVAMRQRAISVPGIRHPRQAVRSIGTKAP